MSQLISAQEQEWLRKLNAAGALGASGQNFELRSSEAWNERVEKSGLLQYPPRLGYDPELQNYVLFDFYETNGESINKEGSQTDTSNLTDSEIEQREDLKGETEKAVQEGIKGLGIEPEGQVLEAIGDNVAEQFQNFTPDVDPKQLAIANSGRGLFSYNSVRLGFANKIQRTNVSVALPMPGNIKSNYELEYEDTDFTGLMNVIATKDALRDMAVNGSDLSSEGKEVIRKLVSVPTAVVDSLGSIFSKDGEGLNLNEALSMRRRQAPNRFKDQVFKGVKRRSFSFEWDFSPRSINDVLTIHTIAFAFKKYSHPKRTEGGLYLDYPGQFKIGFYNGDSLNDFLFRIALCACTKCELTYGGEDLNFMRSSRVNTGAFSENTAANGAPATTMKLSLDFTELELLTRERIEQGY